MDITKKHSIVQIGQNHNRAGYSHYQYDTGVFPAVHRFIKEVNGKHTELAITHDHLLDDGNFDFMIKHGLTTATEPLAKTLKRVKIYDNGGKTIDRYTAIFLDRPEGNQLFDAIGFSENPFCPQGFGQTATAARGRHLGKLIRIEELPTTAQEYVLDNM